MSHPWSFIAPADQVLPLSLTPGENTLQYEPILSAKNAWGPVEKNTSNGEQKAGDGRAITLNGQTYPQGYGVHAGSELRFSLKGTNGTQCTRFSVDVGVDDEVGSRGSVIFQVFLDGELRWDTGRLTGDYLAQRIDLDITGKRELRLVVTDAGDGISYDHADWADPRIYCTDKPLPVGLSLDRSLLTVFHKHSASVRATFSSDANVSGPLDLRLERLNSGLEPNLPRLETTRVNFSGPGTTTQDISIAAPTDLLSNVPEDIQAPYLLIASAGGRDVASALLTIGVRGLKVSARFEPTFVSGRDGEIKRGTVVVTVDPPLDGPLPIRLGFWASGWTENESDFTRILGVDPSRGDGATMRADFDLSFFDRPGLPDDRTTDRQNLIVYVGDLFGYRRPYYGNLYAPLDLKLIR
ncbi:NPCBM/NEW2 domain-containing protein [Deinococcus sp. YIM 134068]|uniref:NPCBM/NEW2 domain-containing protein n=1 Tax=Deinococcus lichenicola TaxID=3118910 RepID=UPI002F92452F